MQKKEWLKKESVYVCVCDAKLVDDGEQTAHIFNIGFTIIIIIVIVVIIDLLLITVLFCVFAN